jgi:CrcB protein
MADGFFVRYALVAVGSAIGGSARYAVGNFVAHHFDVTFPWATFLVNATGSFVLGFFTALAVDVLALDPRWRLLVAVGVCGGYTTFSTFAYETTRLVETREYALAAANVAASAVAGLAAVWLGGAAARWFA